MLSNSELERMKEAYGLLYIIEHTLRDFIVSRLESTYGLNWYQEGPKSQRIPYYKKSFSRLYYHELIPFLTIYPSISNYVPIHVVNKLRQLTFIRNKIAHNICLTNTELSTLNNCHGLILRYCN